MESCPWYIIEWKEQIIKQMIQQTNVKHLYMPKHLGKCLEEYIPNSGEERGLKSRGNEEKWIVYFLIIGWCYIYNAKKTVKQCLKG